MTQWSFRHSGMMLLLSAVAVWAVAATRHRAAALLLCVVVTAELFLFAPSLTPTTGPLVYTMPSAHAAGLDRSPGARRVYHTEAFEKFFQVARLSAFSGVDGLYAHMASLRGSEWATPQRLLAWASQAAGRRFDTLDDLDTYLKDPSGEALILTEAAQYEYYKEALRPNTHMLFGVPVFEGFDVIEVLWSARLARNLQRHYDVGSPVIRKLFGVGTLVDYTRAAPHFVYRGAEDGAPRSFLTTSVTRATDDDQAFALVTAPSFDPRQSIVLIGPDADDAAGRLSSVPRHPAENAPSGAPAAPEPVGNIHWTSDTGNRQTLEVSSPSPSLLCVADAWYPTFRARVDGRPAPLYRANYAFRAVPLPAGASTVELYYHPTDLYAGIAATALGLLGLVVAVLLLARRRILSLPLDASR